MVAETATPSDVGLYHFYSTPSLGEPAWRVYRDHRPIGMVERHRAGFGAFTPGREMAAGGMKSRMDAARWLWARAEAGA
jgi:hypothetical protein